MKKLIFGGFLLLLTITVSPTLQAQSYGQFINNGFGFHISGGAMEDATEGVLGAGYVFNPEFEAGLLFSSTEDDEGELTLTGIGPFAGFYPVRQSDEIPISIRIGTHFQFLSLSGEFLDLFEELGFDVDATGSELMFNGTVFHAFNTSDRLQIVPHASVGYFSRRSKIEVSGFGESESETDTEGSVNGGIGGSLFFLRPDGNTKYALTPQVTFGDDATLVSLSFSVLLPGSR